MPVPDYETLMLPVLRLFGNRAENVKECVPALISEFGITPEEASELIPSGRISVVGSRTHWARTYLSKAGLLESPKRNLHVITERGRSVLAERPDRIDNAFLSRFREFGDWRQESKASGDPSGQNSEISPEAEPTSSPDEILELTHAKIEAALAAELLAEVGKIDPKRFERLIQELLIRMGCGGGVAGPVRSTGNGADGGIDGIIFEDALGLDAVYLQAKRYAPDRAIGRPDIQRFVGSLTGEGATKGVFVTTSTFSRDTEAYVARVPQRIVLIDGVKLAGLMIRHEVGVRALHTFVLHEIDENWFTDTE